MNYSNYLEYFLDLKSTFKEGNNRVQPQKDLDDDFEKVFLANLLDKVRETWSDYECMSRDSYLLLEEELDRVWNASTEEMLNNMLARLSDIGYINTSVNRNGDIVYSVSEDGLEYLQCIKK